MAEHFEIHPQSPQKRLLEPAVKLLARGKILAVPTDSSYALVCHLDDKAAAERLRQLRGKDSKHNLTLLCRDLNELSLYAKADNKQFRLIKSAIPGPYTFILEATKEVPRRVSHPSKKTIGLRVPEHKVLQALLELHNSPLLSTSLIPIDSDEALNDPEEILELYDKQIDAVIDSGSCPMQSTTVLDLTSGEIVVLRQGAGDLAKIGIHIK